MDQNNENATPTEAPAPEQPVADPGAGLNQSVEQFDGKAWAHKMRVEVDANLAAIKKVKDIPYAQNPFSKGGIREIKLAYTKLQEAKMWLGKVLEELGSELPAEFQDKAE